MALAIATVAAIAGVSSCTLFANLTADAPDANDANAQSDAETGPFDDGCRRAAPPKTKPDVPDDGGGLSFFAVVSSLNFSGDAGDFGFDLDDHCTCHPHDGGMCVRSGKVDASPPCDGDGGVDNAFNRLLDSVLFGSRLDATMQRNIEDGSYSLIFRIESYNGGRDDKKVTFSVFRSIGPARDGGVSGQTVKPRFDDKNQEWTVDREGIATEQPLTATQRVVDAYVLDGILIARFSGDMTIDRDLDVLVTSAVVTAKIEQDLAGDHFLANVLVGGRWEAQTAIKAVGSLEDDNRVPLCRMPVGGQKLWEGARDLICDHVDVAKNSNEDGTADCTALSLAVRMQTRPLVKDPRPETNKPPLDKCVDAGIDTRCN